MTFVCLLSQGSPSTKRRGQMLQPIIEGETAHFFEEIKVILKRNHSVIFFLKEKLTPWHVWFSVCIYIYLGRRRRWCLSVLWVKWYLENCCTGTVVIGKLGIWCWRKSGKTGSRSPIVKYSSSFYVCMLVCDFSLFM